MEFQGIVGIFHRTKPAFLVQAGWPWTSGRTLFQGTGRQTSFVHLCGEHNGWNASNLRRFRCFRQCNRLICLPWKSGDGMKRCLLGFCRKPPSNICLYAWNVIACFWFYASYARLLVSKACNMFLIKYLSKVWLKIVYYLAYACSLHLAPVACFCVEFWCVVRTKLPACNATRLYITDDVLHSPPTCMMYL